MSLGWIFVSSNQPPYSFFHRGLLWPISLDKLTSLIKTKLQQDFLFLFLKSAATFAMLKWNHPPSYLLDVYYRRLWKPLTNLLLKKKKSLNVCQFSFISLLIKKSILELLTHQQLFIIIELALLGWNWRWCYTKKQKIKTLLSVLIWKEKK